MSPTKHIFISRIIFVKYPPLFYSFQNSGSDFEFDWMRHVRDLSKSEQRLSLVLIMIAVIFILSSLPRIIIMMYDVLIIDTIRWANNPHNWNSGKQNILTLSCSQVVYKGGSLGRRLPRLESPAGFCVSRPPQLRPLGQLHSVLPGGEQVQVPHTLTLQRNIDHTLCQTYRGSVSGPGLQPAEGPELGQTQRSQGRLTRLQCQGDDCPPSCPP